MFEQNMKNQQVQHSQKDIVNVSVKSISRIPASAGGIQIRTLLGDTHIQFSSCDSDLDQMVFLLSKVQNTQKTMFCILLFWQH